MGKYNLIGIAGFGATADQQEHLAAKSGLVGSTLPPTPVLMADPVIGMPKWLSDSASSYRQLVGNDEQTGQNFADVVMNTVSAMTKSQAVTYVSQLFDFYNSIINNISPTDPSFESVVGGAAGNRWAMLNQILSSVKAMSSSAPVDVSPASNALPALISQGSNLSNVPISTNPYGSLQTSFGQFLTGGGSAAPSQPSNNKLLLILGLGAAYFFLFMPKKSKRR